MPTLMCMSRYGADLCHPCHVRRLGKRMRKNDMVFTVFVIVTVLSALTGTFLIYSGLKDANACSAYAAGKVVEIRCTSSTDGDSYAPVVEFSRQTTESYRPAHGPERVSSGTRSRIRLETPFKQGTIQNARRYLSFRGMMSI